MVSDTPYNRHFILFLSIPSRKDLIDLINVAVVVAAAAVVFIFIHLFTRSLREQLSWSSSLSFVIILPTKGYFAGSNIYIRHTKWPYERRRLATEMK